jgi:hypothetical protein
VIDPIFRAPTPQAEDDRASIPGVWKDEPESAVAGAGNGVDPELASLRGELERLRQRESQIMSLINCKQSDKLLHDLRNILNELQLLRMLVETEKSD